MKKSNLLIITIFTLLVISGCKRDSDNLDVDMGNYPIDIAEANDVDEWIKENFINLWNIEVDYRFNRHKGDVTRNISPIEINKVIPVLEVIKKGFIEPYAAVGGDTFGKKYFHKEWILFGSPSYNNDNSYILGTSASARTMTLYDLNRFDDEDGGMVKGYIRTVFHEFTHALNQTIPIPPAFDMVSVPDYEPDWTNVSGEDARNLGFVTPYAGSQPGEDFAETVAHIVVEGPVWYNNLLETVGTSSLAYARFKEKESIVAQYMLNSFGVDLYELQTEVRRVLKETYGVEDPADITGFPYQLERASVNNIAIDPEADHYQRYGASSVFVDLFENFRDGVEARGRSVQSIQFEFPANNKMLFRVKYSNPSSGVNLEAAYDFDFELESSTGTIKFIKSTTEGTSTAHGNGQFSMLLVPFNEYILPYLIGNEFVADFLPNTISSGDPEYKSFAGFYVSDDEENYFYGPVTYK